MSNKDFPQIIYFDTNAIRELSYGISNVDYLKLKDFCKTYKIDLAVPEVVAYEWYFMQKKEVISEISRIKQGINKLSLLLNVKQDEYEPPTKLFPSLITKVNQYIRIAGMRFVRTTRKISIRKLMIMAAQKVRPFEEKGEKGFRDMLILLTMMDDMKRKGYKQGIFITADDIFEHEDVQRQIHNKWLDIKSIKGYNEAQKYLETILNVKVNELIKQRNEDLLMFLKSKSKDIFRYIVNNAEVSEDFLSGNIIFTKREDKINGKIERVLSVSPIDITSVFPSLTGKKKPLPDNQEYITFTVNTEFKLVVSSYLFFNRPKFPIGAPDQYEKVKSTTPPFYGLPDEMKVTREINVEAIVEKEVDKFIGFRIVRIITY